MTDELPKFDQQSLENVLIAIAKLCDDRGQRLCILPRQVLNQEMLKQLPEGLK